MKLYTTLLFVACISLTKSALVPTKPPSASNCHVTSADVAFIIDSSNSVQPTEWQQALQFAANIVKGYDIGVDKVRVALIVYSSNAQIVFDFNKYTTAADIMTAITNAPKESLNTYTNRALDLARVQLFHPSRGMRPDVPNLLFVITDGQSTDGPLTVKAANYMRAINVTVFAIGVKGAVLNELKTIASTDKLVYNYMDFNKLIALQDTFNKEACKVAVKLAPPTTPAPVCVVKTADIAFIIDASGSVGTTEWRQSLEFAANIVKSYDIGRDKVRVALIVFGTRSTVIFDFNQYSNQAQIVSAIKSAHKPGGGTATNLALDMARDRVFHPNQGDRPGIPNILFVLTDGVSNSASATLASARTVHAKGITVIAVGVKGATPAELQGIASKPALVYSFINFNSLVAIQDQFKTETCKVAVKLAPKTLPPPIPTKPQPVVGCKANSADIVFVVDTSSSVGEANFNLTKLFLQAMMERLDLSQYRVGVMKFNNKAATVFKLSENNDLKSAQAAIDSMKYNHGAATRISAALKRLREVSFTPANGDRPNAPNIAILLTDGQAKDTYRTQFEANLTKKAGIELFSVGVGKDINQIELSSVASSSNYVYLVQSFAQLIRIRDVLARKLCGGFTLPTTTMAAPCLCRDKEDDCEAYGKDLCFKANIRHFAKDKCPSYCDLCPPGCKRVLPKPKPCRDAIPDCASKTDVCNLKKYKKYALDNCPNYCKICFLLNPKPIIQTTPVPTTTQTTTTATTTVKITHPTIPTKPTPFAPCDNNCYDKAKDCQDYNKASCSEKKFEGFYKANCERYCGFCTEKPSCLTTPKPCADDGDCSGFADSACINYPEWAKKTCPMRCGLCPGGVKVVKPTSPPICEDKEDCTGYGKDVCTDYPVFAKETCPRTCKFCIDTRTTTTEKCVDKRNCGVYLNTYCTDPDYRPFMLRECRVFCKFC